MTFGDELRIALLGGMIACRMVGLIELRLDLLLMLWGLIAWATLVIEAKLRE